MSSPLNLDLDFLDYTPTTGQEDETAQGSAAGSGPQQDRPGLQIRIPESAVRQQTASSQPKRSPAASSGNLFQNLISSATGSMGGSQAGVSDEALRQIMWVANRQRQGQQKKAGNTPQAGSFNWVINYLSQYFDVTTQDVIERCLWSAIPLRKTGLDLDHLDADTDELMAPLATDESQFSPTDPTASDKTPSHSRQRPYSHMERFIQSRPDLYGPFWVSATVVFVIAIFSNIASFANHHSKMATAPAAAANALGGNNTKSAEVYSDQIGAELDSWHYSMDELNTSSSVVMFYVTMMPILVWFCFWFRGCGRYYTLTETVCAYGYSLSVFIPLAVMLTIQNILFRFLMISLAAALSGIVLMLSFLPVVKSDPNPASSHIVLILVPLCQFGLAYVIHRIMLQ